MSYQLLERISGLPLPYEFGGDDVDVLRAYVAAGFVLAEFWATDIRNDKQQTARVSKVTRSGRKALLKSKRFR